METHNFGSSGGEESDLTILNQELWEVLLDQQSRSQPPTIIYSGICEPVDIVEEMKEETYPINVLDRGLSAWFEQFPNRLSLGPVYISLLPHISNSLN